MSRTTVLGVIPGQRPTDLLELHNGHGWSPSIWSRLLAHHGHATHWINNDAGLNKLWQQIETLPEWQQAPLVLTFDTGVIPWQAFDWAAAMLSEFEKRLPSEPDFVNHVPAVAELLRSAPEVPLIGVYGTSVSENPFDPRHYCDAFDPIEEVEGGCPFIAEHGYCDGHGSGLPLDGMYLLRQHRHWFPDYRKDWAPDVD